MANDESSFLEPLYASTLDPQQLDFVVDRWVERVGRSMADSESMVDAQLERHLRIALRMLDQHDQAPEEHSAAVITSDSQGRIQSANTAAKQLYHINANGRVDELPFDTTTLKLVKRLLSERPLSQKSEGVQALVAERIDTEVRLLLTLSRDAGGLWRIYTSEIPWSDELSELLANSFELTAAETEIIRLLTHGFSIEELAKARSRSVATVRTQVRSIYAKTSVTSLPELIRLMVGAASHLVQPPQTAAKDLGEDAPYPREDNRYLFRLPDGRQLDYSEFGAAQGYPVLFLHHEICGDGWTAEAVSEAQRLNLRVIVPLRPNYGRTEPHLPGTNLRSRQTAEDFLLLLDHLSIDRYTLLTHTMGGICGIYLLEIAPERIHGVVSVCPPMPVNESHLRHINPLTRMMLLSVAHNPLMARFILRVRLAFRRQRGSEEFLKTHFKHPSDHRLLADPQIYGAILHGSAAVRANGNAGYLSDLETETETSESAAQKITRPVKFIIGDQDGNGRRVRAQSVIDAGAPAEIVSLENSSDLVFYQHVNAILQYTREFASN